MEAKLIFFLVLITVSLNAKANDGFFLVQWGRWQLEDVRPALEKAYALGAKSISMIVDICQEDQNASEVKWCWETHDDKFIGSFQEKRISSVIDFIQDLGMDVTLSPFVHSPTLAKKRHKIKPNHFGKWFMSHAAKMKELGEYAERKKVKEFIVGSELSKLFKDEKGWRKVITDVRAVYSGHVTISTILIQYPFIKFWDALDSIGISAYFPLSLLGLNSSVKKLERSWKLHRWHLKHFAKKKKKPITFSEIGYPSTNVAARFPWDYQWKKRKKNLEIQSRCYEAFYRVWKDEKILRSFKVWSIGTQDFSNGKGFNPFGKPAEKWIFKMLHARH